MIRPDHRKAILVECALPRALEAVGERWSFLILRGAFNGLAHFEEFQSTLGIARNILSNRLARLVEHDILEREPDPADRRKIAYRLTEKGIDLAPVMLELLIWGARHQKTGVPCEVVEHLSRNRAQVLAETRRRWEQRDATPILLSFETKHDKHRSARQ